MSEKATWSTEATSLARVAELVVLTLGSFSLVSAALLLTLGREFSRPAALFCLALTAVFVVLRIRRMRRRHPFLLSWCSHTKGFLLAGMPGTLQLLRVWQGLGWVTLGLRHPAAPHKVLRLVVWKSAVPAPLWSELVLRIEECAAGEQL